MSHIHIIVRYGNTYNILPYTSEWAANIMAQKYFKCSDVSRVTVIETTTAEVLAEYTKEA